MYRACIAFIFISTSAMAVLGERDSSTVSSTTSSTTPKSATAARSRTQILRTTSAYFVREQTNLGGNIIREYVANNGVVFAVSWQGPSHPDVKELLGRYANEAKQAHSEHRRKVIARQALSRVQTSNIVYERSGHMGDLHGLAYIPTLLPNGVTERELHE